MLKLVDLNLKLMTIFTIYSHGVYLVYFFKSLFGKTNIATTDVYKMRSMHLVVYDALYGHYVIHATRLGDLFWTFPKIEVVFMFQFAEVQYIVYWAGFDIEVRNKFRFNVGPGRNVDI